jgi:hypothetical protein
MGKVFCCAKQRNLVSLVVLWVRESFGYTVIRRLGLHGQRISEMEVKSPRHVDDLTESVLPARDFSAASGTKRESTSQAWSRQLKKSNGSMWTRAVSGSG